MKTKHFSETTEGLMAAMWRDGYRRFHVEVRDDTTSMSKNILVLAVKEQLIAEKVSDAELTLSRISRPMDIRAYADHLNHLMPGEKPAEL